MKKLFSVFTILAMLLSLASCTVICTTTAESTPVPTSPPQTTDAPAPTPPPEPLTETEQIDLFASLLDEAMQPHCVAVQGTAHLVRSDGTESSFSVSGCYAYADPPEASAVFVSQGAEALGGELYLKDRVLYLLREEKAGAPTLVRFSELALYLTLCEKAEQMLGSLAELHRLLSEHAPELDALFGLSGEKISSADLLSLVSLLGRSCTDALSAIGVELDGSFEGDASVREAAKALYYLCTEGYDDGEQCFTLTPTRILTLLSSRYTELEARLDRTVTSILDEHLGQGKTAELYRRLASFTGSDPLSLWRTEIESILVSEGLRPNAFYRTLASLLDRSMTAEMTAERLLKLLDENAAKPLDEVIGLFWEDKTYTGFMRDLHSILSMPPTSIYTAFGGVGELGDRLSEGRSALDRAAASLDFSLVLDLEAGAFSSALISFSFEDAAAASDGTEPRCIGLSLSLGVTLSESLPDPSRQLTGHPDFRGN